LREADVAYNAPFDTEKEILSMGVGGCFDRNAIESTGYIGAIKNTIFKTLLNS